MQSQSDTVDVYYQMAASLNSFAGACLIVASAWSSPPTTKARTIAMSTRQTKCTWTVIRRNAHGVPDISEAKKSAARLRLTGLIGTLRRLCIAALDIRLMDSRVSGCKVAGIRACGDRGLET